MEFKQTGLQSRFISVLSFFYTVFFSYRKGVNLDIFHLQEDKQLFLVNLLGFFVV